MLRFIFLVAILSVLSISCTYNVAEQYTYRVPEQTDDGLIVGTLNEVRMDSVPIIKALDRILAGRYKEVHSLLIYKDGKLVLEEYFSGHRYQWDAPRHQGELVNWNRNMRHSIMSDTKSITSACVGIAVDQGLIQDVNQSIFDYLPEHQHLKTRGKSEITIEHLLTMTSGLDGNEWTAPYASKQNPIVALWFPPCKDPVTCILEKPLVSKPSTSFSYFGGNMIVLGEIIKHATGMTIDAFSEKYLFAPLGVDSADWSLRFENGVIEAAGGLQLTPRDMIKVGATFLNRGLWKESQIISEQWIEKCATPYGGNTGIKIPGEDSGRKGYAYSWWTNQLSHSGRSLDVFYAGGWGGQKIVIIPEMSTVVVFTGGNYLTETQELRIINKYIIPAMNQQKSREFGKE
ncbi:MAG: serine hydrolase [Bacteroidota bacterium]